MYHHHFDDDTCFKSLSLEKYLKKIKTKFVDIIRGTRSSWNMKLTVETVWIMLKMSKVEM